MSNTNKEQSFEIIEDIGIIGRSDNGNVKKLVFIKWYNHPPIYEIREFEPNGKALKRCGLTPQEFEVFKEILIT